MRIYYNPNKPGDREATRFGLGLVLIIFGDLIWYIVYSVSFFKGKNYTGIIAPLIVFIILAIFTFFLMTAGETKESRIKDAKFIFPLLGCFLVDLTGIIAIIVSISSLCHKGTGAILLIGSIITVSVVSLLGINHYRKIMGKEPIKLFTHSKETVSEKILPTLSADKKERNETNDLSYIYCHKCGKKLPSDSVFCNSCGIKLK